MYSYLSKLPSYSITFPVLIDSIREWENFPSVTLSILTKEDRGWQDSHKDFYKIWKKENKCVSRIDPCSFLNICHNMALLNNDLGILIH